MALHVPKGKGWERLAKLPETAAEKRERTVRQHQQEFSLAMGLPLSRRAAGTASGSWPQGAVCVLCGQPVERLQSAGCDSEGWRHLAAKDCTELRRQRDVTDAHIDTGPA